mgnify:CR=1 FL=1
MAPIHILNPNSLASVSEAIAVSVAPLARAGEVEVHTSQDGPPGIQSHAEFEACQPPLLRLARELEAEALVVACFSDPGVEELKRVLPVPVIGIQDASVREAIALKKRFGIVAVVEASVERHRLALARRGQDALWVGSRALNLDVRTIAEEEHAQARILEVGHALKHRDGAEVLILGCAGMSQHAAALEDAVGLPVIEPCQAGLRAARQAISAQVAT